MPKIILKPNEKIDFALRRFKKACDKDKTIQTYKEHQFYTNNTDKRVEEQKLAVKKEKKRQKNT